MNIITKDIKTIKDLRKYVNSIDWYNKEWNEKDNEQFVQKGLICQRSTEKVNGSISDVYHRDGSRTVRISKNRRSSSYYKKL